MLIKLDLITSNLDPLPYTCFTNYNNIISPAIYWTPVWNTKSYALTVVDIDTNNLVHWLVTYIPSAITYLAPGANNEYPLIQGPNQKGINDFLPFCPSYGSGTHRYKFTVYALDNFLHNHINIQSFYRRISGHVLDSASIIYTLSH